MLERSSGEIAFALCRSLSEHQRPDTRYSTRGSAQIQTDVQVSRVNAELATEPAYLIPPDPRVVFFGQRLGRVEIPPDVRLLTASARFAWGVTTDALDVPVLLRFQMPGT